MAKFKHKQIEIHIEFNKNMFGEEGKIYKLSSFATHVEVQKPGLPDKAKAKVIIYGLSMATMEELTLLAFKPFEISNNRISIYAGEVDSIATHGGIEILDSAQGSTSDSNLSLVFRGEITRAFANFNSMPESTFEIHAMTGYFPSLIPSKSISYKGAMPLPLILAALAKLMDYDFENIGFTGSLKNPILSGSLFEKMIKASRASGAYLICDDCKFTLLPARTANSSQTYTLSAQNGLVGYPQFHNDGVKITALYSNNFKFNGLIALESLVPKASGIWRVTNLSHKLSANSVHDSSWFSQMYAAYAGS